MSNMDHAAAHERIEFLILEPARLRALAASDDPEDVALRDHVDDCRTCRADLETWERLQRRVVAALPASAQEASIAVQTIEAPASLRASVIAGVRAASPAEAVRPAAIPIGGARARRPALAWFAAAASIVIIVGASIITVDQVNRRATAEVETQALSAALAAVDRMLAVDHKVVQLETTDGRTAGTISWSRHDWVVLTTALEQPASGNEYLCWLETDGRSVPVGRMDFAGGTAYWVATLDEWQTWEIGPTTQFVVTLEPADAQARTGPAVLSADLASS